MKIWAYVAALAILASLVGGLVHLSKKASQVDAAEARAAAAEKEQLDQAKKFATKIDEFNAHQERDTKKDEELGARLTKLEGVANELARAASRIKPTAEKTDAQGVRHDVVAGDWWLCQSAQLSGNPADAAACVARPGDGSVRTSERQ